MIFDGNTLTSFRQIKNIRLRFKQEDLLRLMSLCVTAFLFLPLTINAQQPTTPSNTQTQEASTKSKRKRGKVSKSADFSGAGLLQFEYGYDGNFRAPDASRDQAGTASLIFNATEDLQFEVDFDTFHSTTDNANKTATGIGDAYVSLQFTMVSETHRSPSLAFGYLVKLPTASESEGLGSGRVDHKLRFLASKKIRKTDVDFNAALLVNGDPGTSGHEAGYQLALSFSRELKHGFALEGGIFGESLDTDQPRGIFLEGGGSYQPSTRFSYDFGVRFGLTANAPSVGIFAGISVSLANLYHRKP
jgi:hypothetical protein